MKFLHYFLLCLSAFAYGQSEQDDYILEQHTFEKGSVQYLFGDRVVLRIGPSKESASVDTLSIGSAVKIVEKTDQYGQMGGMDWCWYKVKAGKKNGYILASLISFTSEATIGGRYLVSMRRADETAFARYRFLKDDGQFLEGESELNTWKFEFEVHDNRGIEGIQNMLYIDYFAEACGIDGGGIYIFNDGHSLIEALRVASVADGGAFWFTEELIFPNDEEGLEGTIQYRRESGESMDEDMNWIEIQATIFNLHWGDGKLYPEIPPARTCQ